MRELQQELQKYDIPVTIPEQQGHTDQYRYVLLELRDKLFGSVTKINSLADNTNINTAANDLTEKEFNEYRQTIHHLQLSLLKVCVIFLGIDQEFPRVLQQTEKYLTSLETKILPYYNYNNTNEIEPLDVYHQRLKNYTAELVKYETMVLSGAENASVNHTALSMAFFIKNIFDIETAGESEIPDYFTTLKRLVHFENIQLQYLDKILQLKIKIDNILNHSPTVTLSKILSEQRRDPPVKKILITVSFSKKEENYRISGHHSGGHMLAILFDGDKPPLCISRFPIRNEKSKKYYNYQGNLTQKEKGGLFAYLIKLAGLPHKIYSATNIELDHEIKIQAREKRTILPPIVFYCTDNLGIDFDKALAEAIKNQQGPLTLDFEDNCAEPIRKIIEAGISERNLELDSSSLMGITVPMTLYKNLQKLHNVIQAKRDIVAKKLFAMKQKQLESATLPNKIGELILNIRNARNALESISDSIKELINHPDPDQLDTLNLIEYYLELLDNLVLEHRNDDSWSTIDEGKLFLAIQNFVSLEEQRCKDLLIRFNKNQDSRISADKFVDVTIKELIKLYKIKKIKIPLYFEAPLLTLTELLKTLPIPYTTHLEQICEYITKELPPTPKLALDLPLQIHSRFMEALKPVYRNDDQPNLLHNTMQLRNIILDIQFKQAKFTETKLRLDPKHESAVPLLKQLEQAISYCQKSAELLQSAYGKLNQALYFESLDIVARKEQPNPFNALKKIFPSINHYYHLQDIFNETADFFPSNNLAKPRFWQIWKKYEYKIQLTNEYVKNTFNTDQCSSRNYTAMKKKISKLKTSLWDQFWLSNKTLKQRRKHYNELSDKVHLLFLLKSFAQGALSGSELILQLKSLADKSVSIHKDNIAQLYQNLSETQQFYLQLSDREQIDNYEQTALKTLTSTTAILLRCNYPDRSKLPSKGVSAKSINEIFTLDEKMNYRPSLFVQNNVTPREEPVSDSQLPEDFEERLYSIRSTYLPR